MTWLDNYIRKNQSGYLINAKGGIFVDRGNDMVTPIKGDGDPLDLVEITKDEFLDKLIKN